MFNVEFWIGFHLSAQTGPNFLYGMNGGVLGSDCSASDSGSSHLQALEELNADESTLINIIV